MNIYYRQQRRKKQKGIIWSDTLRIRMASPRGGGGGGGGAGGNGGNGGTIAVVTSNLTPLTNNPMGTWIPANKVIGTKPVITQKFANMIVTGGSAGGTGVAGAAGLGGAQPGAAGQSGLEGYEGLAFVQIV
jgi:hypothetical protein